MLSRYSLAFASALCFFSTHSLAQDARTLEWVKPSLSSIPSARYGAGIAYDLAMSSTVLFGGSNTDGNTYLNDTWVWSKNGWVQQLPANSPSPRTTNMAYDATTGTVVLFGGDNGSEPYLGDTWTWDGVTWTQQFPPMSPSPRTNNGMTFDAATGTILLFGGLAGAQGSGDVLNDTWEWNGKTKRWTHLFPASSPSPRRTTITYDGATGNVVLFGGDKETSPGTYYDDTWTWNGVTWTEQFPSSAPTGRVLNSLNYYPETGTVILFGGLNWPNALGDTWIWNGTTWTEIQTTLSPSPRWQQSVGFDPNSKGLVLFGGVLTGAVSTVGDTWLLILHR